MIKLELPIDDIDNWEEAVTSEINRHQPKPLPDTLDKLYEYKFYINNELEQVNSIVIQAPAYDPDQEVEEYFASLAQKNEELKASLLQQEQDEIASVKQENEEYNLEVKKYNSHLTDKVRIKHEELKSYKEVLNYVFQQYHISPGDMTIKKNLSEKEFLDMLHVSLSVCRKYKTLREKDYVYRYASKLKKNDGIYALWTLLVLVILGYITLPITAVMSYLKLFKTVNDVSTDIEALTLARSLMSEVDYMNLIDKSKLKSISADPDTTSISEEIHKKIDEIPDFTNDKEEAKARAVEILAEYNKVKEEYMQRLTQLLNDVKEEVQTSATECQKRIDEILEDYSPFPSECKTSYVMCHDFVFARKYDSIDVSYTLPSKNLLFRYKDDEDRQRVIDRCKIYLCNMMLSIQPRKLSITISDPVHQGAEFAEFLIPGVSEYLKVVDTDFSDSIKELRKVTMSNIKTIGTKTIDEFNKMAEEQDMIPVSYQLLIIASGIQHDEKGNTPSYDDKLQAYFQESVNQGVHIWVIDTAKYVGMLEDAMTNDQFDDDTKLIEYTEELGTQAVNVWADAIEDFRPPALIYRERYLDKLVPHDKWWTYDTIKGIDLHFGYQNGDPTKWIPTTLCDSAVHALMGGKTGSGKSATINQTLMTLIAMYPPSELELMFIDFKNVEAAKFATGIKEDGTYMTQDEMTELNQNNVFYRQFSIIPHMKVISGTTDGGYALSLFKSLNEEMNRRQAILNKYGKMKVEDLRKELLNKYAEHIGKKKVTWHEMRQDWEYYKPNILDKGLEIPRLLVICDEFQVMFNDKVVPARIIDQISGLITLVTKLGRAMSCHLWFTSQSMKGTLSNDTKSNFSVRMALNSDSAISDDLIGNPAASKMPAPIGYIYITKDAENPNANQLFRIPFASDSAINKMCEDVNQLLKDTPTEKSHNAEFFDDKQLMPATLIDEWYESYPENFSNDTTFILGERAEYSVNKAPITCVLTNDTAENMLIAGFIRDDLLNLVMTVVKNIKKKKDNVLLFNIADKAAYDLVQPEQFVQPELASLCGPDVEYMDLIDMICDIVEQRLETHEWDKRMYIVLVYWENTSVFGFGRREDKINKALRFGPTVGVNFFIACGSRTQDFVSYVPKACNHRYCAQLPKDAYFFINTNMVEKFPTIKTQGNFAAYEFGNDAIKLKIYQHQFAGDVVSREVIL